MTPTKQDYQNKKASGNSIDKQNPTLTDYAERAAHAEDEDEYEELEHVNYINNNYGNQQKSYYQHKNQPYQTTIMTDIVPTIRSEEV